MGFFRRLFGGAERPVGKHPALAMGYGKDKPKLRLYRLEGKVLKDSEHGSEVLASGGCTKEAVSGQALKDAWERDMKIAFPMGADYNVEYHCTVTDVTEADDESDDGDDKDVALAAVAAVGAATLFR